MPRSTLNRGGCKPCCAAVLLVGILGLASSARATVDWSLNGSVGYDANPDRVAVDPHGSGTLFGGGTLTVDELRPRLTAQVGANLGYIEYLSGGLGGQVIGSLVADLRYALVPKQLFWVFDDRFGQGTANTLAPPSIGNRENVNVLSTGPSLVVPLTDLNRFQADARFGATTFSSSDLPDNYRYSGTVSLIHKLSLISALSLSGDYTRVNYSGVSALTINQPGSNGGPSIPVTDTGYGDYDRENVYVGYRSNNKITVLSLDLGVGRVTQNGTDYDAPLVRFSISQRVSPYWTVGLSASQQYTDGSENFSAAIDHSGVPLPGSTPPGVTQGTQTLPLTSQPTRTEQVRATSSWLTTRTLLSADVAAARDRYLVDSQNDDNRINADLGLTRRLTRRSDLHLGARYERREYPVYGATDKTATLNGTYSWQFDPNFQFYTSYVFEKRNSTIGEYAYIDNRFVIGLRYTPTHYRDSMLTRFAPAR